MKLPFDPSHLDMPFSLATCILGAAVGALYVGVTDGVAAINENGVAVTFKAVPAGAVLPVATSRVNATGTTATDIAAL